MNRIAVGLDGTSGGLAAADWAAHEAELRGAALELVHIEDWPKDPPFPVPLPESRRQWAEDLLGQAREQLLREHPALDARTVIGQPAIQILDAAVGAALVVVGRRIRRSALGTHTGPITHAVMHHATSPVAVVAHD
ncbi:universal stress protein [Streptomyces lavendulae]|uniref:universal stress protein n=1 Tax=Streptomyces lavendulae TaxID=1914 RepID=UPI0024A25523|nr:universal stress protein [Streptomyces lavendulae]GLX16630.1 hypothetical protein Slala01_02740 [Streptomyces lavendulae subsp. lavendulae]GLX25251.1 hypothetical protein Slala02_10710 [Streptomyces lavendulae subsp. lavendulae]